MAFKVGDFVTWNSQAAGTWKVKRGEVTEVVATRRRPETPGFGGWREEESYVVRVREPLKRGGERVTMYWPRASVLRKAP